MSKEAEYIVVHDTPFTIASGAGQLSRAFPFTTPANIHPGSLGIISFVLDGLNVDGELRFDVRINGDSVYDAEWSDAEITSRRMVQEVFPFAQFNDAGQTNTVSFEITNTNNEGDSVKFSDVVIWCQVDANRMRTIQMDANGNIWAGGNGENGDIVLRDTNGLERIRLSGGGADIHVGGNAAKGDVMLYSRLGDNRNPDEVTIHLAGEEGDISAKRNITANGAVRAAQFFAGSTALNVPDYVWADDYPLMPLEALRAYVARERRLPNVPGAADIARDGVDIARFQMQLLEKIEELTRYVFQLQDQLSQAGLHKDGGVESSRHLSSTCKAVSVAGSSLRT